MTDNLNMTLSYRFNFALSQVELAIIQQAGVLPKPTGVGALVVIDTGGLFVLDTSMLDGTDVLG